MKKILGLDLGVTSIGWALISVNENKNEILGMGTRIVPYDNESKQGENFIKGSGESKNQKRTEKRTQRKGYDRYQLRRQYLLKELEKYQMLPGVELKNLEKLNLWELRSKAASEKIALKELGRVLLHLNQKRGYKSNRTDANLDKKDTDYVKEVKTRHEKLKDTGLTIGQYFYRELKNDQYYRIKQQVYPREAYMEEYDQIMTKQSQFHQELTGEIIQKIRDEIIYYQRKLKSQKGLVSVCEFEGFQVKTESGKELLVGPKVAHRSSPLFQYCKIWELINTISLKNKKGESYSIPIEKKHEIFNYLDNNENLSFPELLKILSLKKDDGWAGNKQLLKGLPGNKTKMQIIRCLKDHKEYGHLVDFNLLTKTMDEECHLIDNKTGEVKATLERKIIESELEKQPLYQLWHAIYSIPEKKECVDALNKKFGLIPEISEKLSEIDFSKSGFGDKSAKCMRKILPYLMEGYVYSDACSFAGYNHSSSLSISENQNRELLEKIPNLSKNSLRQPVVEKILNQTINVVNAIIEKFGRPDEIRIELSRELKQSREERNETFANISKRERENNVIAERLENEYRRRATRNNIIKWRLFHEINGDESKANATCIYCDKNFGITSALNGIEVDIEHIIPKSLLFDDSQNNKTLSHRSCNSAKGNSTAFDYMKTKSSAEFEAYIERVNSLYKNHIINKTKRDKLLLPADKIPTDFIDRQLRESQYIAKKSRELLMKVCRNVWATSGSVTAYLRRNWGWDEVLMNLRIPEYRAVGLTEFIEFEKDGQRHKKEIIKDWTKRDDHRHHAIDALVIACTKQGYIQRINRLSSDISRSEMMSEIGSKNYDPKKNLLENYIIKQRPFNTSEVMEAASRILISFKAGKKVASLGVRKIKKAGTKVIVQKNIIVPRGALSEESVYGRIKSTEIKPVKYLFENPGLIMKERIREIVKKRLEQHENDVSQALKSMKKNPIYLDREKKTELSFGRCFKEEYVIKYQVKSLFGANDDEKKVQKTLEFVIDPKIRECILRRLYDNSGNFIKPKDAFKDLENKPLWYNEEKKIPILSVRCFTGLSSVKPLKSSKDGIDSGYVKPGNNHHVAIYSDENGNKLEHIVTFLHAVERKKYGIPVIIENSRVVWNKIMENPDYYPEHFQRNLPPDKVKFEFSLQQNEMFILGFSDNEFELATAENNYQLLSKYLYRTQKITHLDYFFRHHLETNLVNTNESYISKRFYRVSSLDAFFKLNPRKVIVNNLGEIKLKN